MPNKQHIKDVPPNKVPRLPREDPGDMRMFLCGNEECGRFLFYEAIVAGVVSIKCRHCKKGNILDITPDGTVTKRVEVLTPRSIYVRVFRCGECGNILFYEAIGAGIVKVKCRHCKKWNILDITPEGTVIEKAENLTPEGIERIIELMVEETDMAVGSADTKAGMVKRTDGGTT